MKVRLCDRKCQNCTKYDSLFLKECVNPISKYYQQKRKQTDTCDRFRPNSICLECFFYKSDSRKCGNRKSPYYDRYVYDRYLKSCSYRLDAGYVASQISDTLGLGKKESYSLILYNLKKQLLEIDKDYQRYVDFYQNIGPYFAWALDFDENAQEFASHLKEEYLNDVFAKFFNGEYIESLYTFISMLEKMNEKYNIIDEEEIAKLTLDNPKF